MARPSAQIFGRLGLGTCQEADFLEKVPTDSTNTAAEVPSDLTLFSSGANIRIWLNDLSLFVGF